MANGDAGVLPADEWQPVAINHEGRIAKLEERANATAEAIAAMQDTLRWVLRTSVGTLVTVLGALVVAILAHRL